MTPHQFLTSLLLLTVLASCHSDADKAAVPAAQASAPPAAPEEVTLTAAQQKAADVAVGGFTWQNVTSPVTAQGVIDVPPQNRVSISAMMGGYVQRINVLPGQHVHQGEVIAVLRDPAYLKLQQDYLQARARVVFLQKELDRQRELTAEDVGARKKLEQATADFQTESAAEKALAAQVRLLGLSLAQLQSGRIETDVPLTSPLDGCVTTVGVNPGQYVAPQTVLVGVVDRSDLHLMIKVFQKDAPQVQIGQKVRFTLANGGTERTARIILKSHAFDETERTVELHAHLDGAVDDLLPGQYVNCRIETAGARRPTLPEDALIQAGEVSYVYARTGQVKGSATFRRFKVKTGPAVANYVAVEPLETLPDTTQIVRRGAYFLDGERVKGQGGDD